MYPNLPVFTRSLGVLLLLGLAVLPRPAQAETTNCMPITTVPFTITTPGIYCLTQDFTTNLASETAITIAANNVVLDLNAHLLGNLQAGSGTAATGIYAFNQKNLTIKNGTVRGFFRGIFLDDTSSTLTTSGGHVIEDIRADQNTFEGIDVGGRGNLIRKNQVVATGGSTLFVSRANPVGIALNGPENRVRNNDIIDTFTGTGASFGIFSGQSPNNLAVNNRITDADVGIEFSGTSTGKYRDNLTSGVATPFSGGTDAGGNN